MEIEEIIYAEIEKCRAEHRAGWWTEYFGNFRTKLCGGWERRAPFFKQTQVKEGSERLKGKTYKQFHEEIDATAIETGLSLDEIERLQKIYLASKKYSDEIKLLGYTLPLYIALRKKGYVHYPDLTS